MKETDEMLEILIGKHLDGEITPSEQRMLQAELDNNFQARELLEQLEDLHQRSREVVASEIHEYGKAAGEIFERAWKQSAFGGKHRLRRMIKPRGYLRFAAGLAAGIAIGLALHFALVTRSTLVSNQVQPNMVAKNLDNEANVQRPILQLFPSDLTGDVIRNVDWYSFTDENGDQWLIEGFRENIVRPAAYDADL